MSTGLECEIVERREGEWYYILQDWDCPAGAFDWMDYATAYGPFATEAEALRNLSDNHANPGGYMGNSLVGEKEDAQYTKLFAEATIPGRHVWGGTGFGYRMGW